MASVVKASIDHLAQILIIALFGIHFFTFHILNIQKATEPLLKNLFYILFYPQNRIYHLIRKTLLSIVRLSIKDSLGTKQTYIL